MNNTKSLESLFKKLFPFISVIGYLIAFAVIFDTFNLDLYSALYNILLSLPFFGLFLMITRRFHVATLITSITAFILFYIDQYVFSARLTHIRFSDIKLISQAARVANRYPLIWNMEIMRRLAIVLLICAFLFFIFYYYKLKYSWKPAFFVGSFIFIVSTIIIVSGIIPSNTEGFDFSKDAEQRGLLYSWYCQQKESHIIEPEGYSKDAAERIISKYTPQSDDDDVNVIVIMNESLSDYSLIGEPCFEDPLPFIHSLVKNGDAYEGKLVVNVFGGGTATTEYEFLTGNSMAFLPEGVSPYLQYVDGKTDNITSELGEIGYSKIAIHPYYSEEWNRSQVYKFFGFDMFISGSDFGDTIVSNGKSATSKVTDNLISFGEGPLYVRGMISDQTSFERILSELGDKSFIFNVTMQNHGGYDYQGDDFTSDEYVTKADYKESTGHKNLNGMLYDIDSSSVEEEVGKVNQYLTCANLSDQAFEYLITELEKSEKKTIVLMFGDHQPGVLISEHYLDVDDGVDSDYTVPYVLWANYNIDFDAPEIVSTNYLSAVLKKIAGIGLTEWDQFRLDMMEEYPVISPWFVLDKDGKTVSKDELKDYSYVQYMRMFD